MTPVVSVVLPVYGGSELLPETFAALRDHTTVAHEVIAVDNASPDGAAGWIGEHEPDVRLLRNRENLGFGVACNQGALVASAPLVCFLNSDARVTAGWFDALADALASVPGARAAVPMYLERDGLLQEAGAVIDGRGEGVLLGHRQDALDRRFRFRRVVEYGSAACLLVRRDTFHAVGGFDAGFGLAYYEDADFALRLAATGQRMVFAPRSSVIHERNASPRPPGLDALRGRNRRRLLDRWPTLADRPPHDDLVLHPDRIVALRDAACEERLLLLVDHLPTVESDAGRSIAAIASAWPDARVTIAAVEPPVVNVDAWLDLGVEIAEGHADWSAWFRDRIAQVTVALTWGATPASHFDAWLRTTQPQAARLHHPGPGEGAEWSASATALVSGDAPAAALVAVGWRAPRDAAHPSLPS